MTDLKIDNLNFHAHYIDNVEISHEVASNCKLRSKFVHERIFQSRNKESDCSVALVACKRCVKVLKASDQSMLSSYPIRHITYSACDKTNRLLALVVRSSESERNHVCHVFRADTPEQAESINRFFGSIFKQLRNKKKDKNEKSFESSENGVGDFEHMPESTSSPSLNKQESDSVHSVDVIDERLRRISTSNIDDLVNEKHFIRRHSLCLPNDELEDLSICDPSQPLHPSLEKKTTSVTVNNTRPLIRRKNPEHKGNRISAVIERLSFRVNKDNSTDFLKSGSPVVALKEQLEFEDGLFGLDTHGNIPHPGNVPRSSSRRQLLPSHPLIPNTGTDLQRKNSAPACSPSEEEPPVPPVRIHSLRGAVQSGTHTPASVTPLARRSRAAQGADQATPCDNDDLRIYNEPPPPSSTIYREQSRSNNNLFSASSKPLAQNFSPNVPTQSLTNFSKEEASNYLIGKETGAFMLRHSASHRGCIALSVKVEGHLVSHYIIQQSPGGVQLKGLEKTWPNIQSLITHLSVIPEILPCPIRFAQPSLPTSFALEDTSTKKLPNIQSSVDEYDQRMRLFLDDVSPISASQDPYQKLSDFSSVVASVDYL